jgi:hypothetical protein
MIFITLDKWRVGGNEYWNVYSILVGKGKGHPITGHESPERE